MLHPIKLVMATLRASRSLPFLIMVFAERIRQELKWGPQRHPSFPKRGPKPREVETIAKQICVEDFKNEDPNWTAIFDKEAAEACCSSTLGGLRIELIQLAAVGAAWWENVPRPKGDDRR